MSEKKQRTKISTSVIKYFKSNVVQDLEYVTYYSGEQTIVLHAMLTTTTIKCYQYENFR